MNGVYKERVFRKNNIYIKDFEVLPPYYLTPKKVNTFSAQFATKYALTYLKLISKCFSSSFIMMFMEGHLKIIKKERSKKLN